MRTLLLATLAFAPVMVHAQAISPAQPQNATELQSKLVAPTPFIAAAAANVPTARRVSTGVVQPKLLSPLHVEVVSHMSTVHEHNVTVSMIVNERGIPSNLKVAQSTDPEINSAVIDAVAASRFTPGTVSNEPASFPVSLKVNVVENGGL